MYLEKEVLALVEMIDNNYDEETGEWKTEDGAILEGLAQEEIGPAMDKYTKAAKYYKTEAELLAEEIKRLQARKKMFENKAERTKGRLFFALKVLGGKFKTTLFTYSTRKTKSLEVSPLCDMSKLPQEFIVVKTDVNKTELKKYMEENGVTEMNGCKVIENESLMIK